MSKSLPEFGKFSAIISLNKHSDLFLLFFWNPNYAKIFYIWLNPIDHVDFLHFLNSICLFTFNWIFQNSYHLGHLFCLPFDLPQYRFPLLTFSFNLLNFSAAEFLFLFFIDCISLLTFSFCSCIFFSDPVELSFVFSCSLLFSQNSYFEFFIQ